MHFFLENGANINNSQKYQPYFWTKLSENLLNFKGAMQHGSEFQNVQRYWELGVQTSFKAELVKSGTKETVWKGRPHFIGRQKVLKKPDTHTQKVQKHQTKAEGSQKFKIFCERSLCTAPKVDVALHCLKIFSCKACLGVTDQEWNWSRSFNMCLISKLATASILF